MQSRFLIKSSLDLNANLLKTSDTLRWGRQHDPRRQPVIFLALVSLPTLNKSSAYYKPANPLHWKAVWYSD